MWMSRKERQTCYSKTVAEQQHCRRGLRCKLDVRAQSAKIVDQAKYENDGSRSHDFQSELRQWKLARTELLWQPMHQKRHAAERKENSDSTQTRYRTRMDMTIRTRRCDPAAGNGKVADQARKCCGRYKRDDKYKNGHYSLGVTSDHSESLLTQRQGSRSGLSFFIGRSSHIAWLTSQRLRLGWLN